MIHKLSEILIKVATKAQENTYLKGISNGLSSVMGVMLIGAMFTLISNINIGPTQEFLTNTGLKELSSIVIQFTTNVFSLYAVFGISYRFAEEFQQDGFSAGILGLIAFFLVTPLETLEDGTLAIPYTWLGASGLFVAMIVALVSTRLYVWIMKKGFYIKMPSSVPPTVGKSFSALIPGFVITLLWLAVRGGFTMTSFGNFHDFIYGTIQAPLVNFGGGNIFTAIAITILQQLFWFFGLHGKMLTNPIVIMLMIPLSTGNLNAYNAGIALPNLLVSETLRFASIGGSGNTIGLNLAMLKAKSKRYRTLGKLAIFPSICSINEPLVYGSPLVLNLVLFIPFILLPVFTLGLGYAMTYLGILPPLYGIRPPLGTPVILNGLLMGGWRIALFEVGAIVLSYFAYLPFFKKLDHIAYQEECLSEEVIDQDRKEEQKIEESQC